MALRVSSPWWLSLVLVIGLFSIFMGERAFAHTDAASLLSWLGCLLVAGSIAARAWVILKSEGAQRKIELISIISSAGTLVALLGYYLSTKSGMSMLGIESAKMVSRWQLVITPLWLILLFCSVLPLFLIEVSLGVVRRASFRSPASGPDASVDVFRVREMASSGLSIALAAAFLMVTCNIADQRNVRKDVSYFKTSSPGSATVNIANALTETVEVMLFFPENNDVVVEVENYLRALTAKTKNVRYELRDRLVDSDLAKKHRVGREGTILLLRGEKSEKFNISYNMAIARKKSLREFDAEFQKALMKVVRDAKVAYFMAGHGELNDPTSAGAFVAQSDLKKSTKIRQTLEQLNYEIKDYQGFGTPVPDDCSVLFVLAPRVALMDEELQAIDEYLARGGSAIISFDPEAAMVLGRLEGRLGVTFNPAPVADDVEFIPRTRTASDHSLILTNQFLSHASVATLSRGAARAAMLFVKAGSFDDVEFDEEKKRGRKKVEIIRTMASGWRDLPDAAGKNNYSFDKATEKRDRYNLVMAIEDANLVPSDLAEGAKHNGMRVILISDVELLSDAILGKVSVVQDMLTDIIKWTGGEEAYAGETISEKDKRIEHTKSQDAIWFYGTMVGAPMLMLGLGLLFIGRRRRRSNRRQS